MSRLAKKLITIPHGVSVKIEGRELIVEGPRGVLKKTLPSQVKYEISEAGARVIVDASQPQVLAGTFSSHLRNMLEGVTKGFEKRLELVGIGYKAQLRGSDLVFSIGYSHPVTVKAREGIEYKVEDNVVIVSGIDKERVGEAAAKIRKLRKDDVYKGKGIYYVGEQIRRKAGKKVAAAG